MSPSAAPGVTTQLSEWISDLKWGDIPERVKEHSKILLLDGIACLLVGSHLPWSEDAVNVVIEIEENGGNGNIFGWKGLKTSILSSALLNSTFLQGFELDDYHCRAPLHSNSILIPALLSASASKSLGLENVSGQDFLLALVTGFEVGPRVGLSVGGSKILSRGWHSGAVFGPSASAAACSKLFGLDARQVEDALGMACTQSCGLMSAQFESYVKRMQHGFAARNGLFAAMLAKSNYKGISQVYEREYGGFCKVFSLGAEPGKPELIVDGLSSKWETLSINMKPYACMAGIHGTIDCILDIKSKHKFSPADITSVKIEMTESSYKHGGWEAIRPLNCIGAQMNASYIAAVVLRDGELKISHFADHVINQDDLWETIEKIKIIETVFPEYPENEDHLCTRMTITLSDGQILSSLIQRPKGVKAVLSKKEVYEKFYDLTKGIISKFQQERIIDVVNRLDTVKVSELVEALDVDVIDPLTLKV